jgi:predicted AAA+ superfamily ATPase
MIGRRASAILAELLGSTPAVALLGPRQVGKTTLALAIAEQRPSAYLDLESAADRAKLADPVLYLSRHEDQLVILDEVHRLPGLFQELRGLIDQGRRRGNRTGRFLLLGSASMDLLQQSGESLAGRISYLELGPLDGLEVGAPELERLWVRGGFPESFWPPATPGALGGAVTSSARTSNATCPCWDRASPRRPCAASGRCWRTTKGPC